MSIILVTIIPYKNHLIYIVNRLKSKKKPEGTVYVLQLKGKESYVDLQFVLLVLKLKKHTKVIIIRILTPITLLIGSNIAYFPI